MIKVKNGFVNIYDIAFKFQVNNKLGVNISNTYLSYLGIWDKLPQQFAYKLTLVIP